jgi:hypothetical protein
MAKTCGRGKILRAAYTRRQNKGTKRVPKSKSRKSYIRHTKKKTIHVPSSCIKSVSQSGKKTSVIEKEIIEKLKKVHKSISKKYGTPKCKKGQVVRDGYKRKAYTRKSGVHVSSSIVKPGCIKAIGMSKKRGTKGKQLFILKKGELTKYGYHSNLTETQRHDALKKALSVIKPLSLYRKLDALYILNKNVNPSLAKLFQDDANWVKTTPEYINRDL